MEDLEGIGLLSEIVRLKLYYNLVFEKNILFIFFRIIKNKKNL